MSKARLGKGLGALIPQLETESSGPASTVSIGELRPNPYQPRHLFDDEKLHELADSIKEHGLIQPILVRKSLIGYEIVAGERRFRAARLAGLDAIPVIVKDLSDRDMMEIALIENIQREDLNVMEVAEAYAQLIERFDLTQEELAAKVGQSRSHVANILRLLQLPEAVQAYVSRGTLSMGHARALIPVENSTVQAALAEEIAENQLSVREAEQRVARLLERVSRETKKVPPKIDADPLLKQYESKFRERLGTSVRIVKGKKRGKVEIDYFSEDDLERLLQLLGTTEDE